MEYTDFSRQFGCFTHYLYMLLPSRRVLLVRLSLPLPAGPSPKLVDGDVTNYEPASVNLAVTWPSHASCGRVSHASLMSACWTSQSVRIVCAQKFPPKLANDVANIKVTLI